MHTFIKTRQDDGLYLYSVGSWAPPAYNDTKITWNPMRDCATAGEAVAWVNYLNGGTMPNVHDAVMLEELWA